MFDLAHIKSIAKEVGFDLCGVTQAIHLEGDKAFLTKWIEAGYASSLDYLKRNIDCRADATALVEGAKSVIVCAIAYKNSTSEGYNANHRAKVASYACMEDYHSTIKSMLFEMCRRLRDTDNGFSGRCFVDSAPIFEKRYAVEAGLGWIGRQSLLVTPQYGTFVLLGEIVMTGECNNYDSPLEGVGCGECRRCIEACPNNAIKGQHIDTSRCISCATIERGDDSDTPLHCWIFGCDECQTICPYNRKAPIGINSRCTPLFRPEEMTAEDWLTIDEKGFNERFGKTPLVRSGYRRIVENISNK